MTIEHRFGSITIDAEPERVLTIGFNEQDFALALGVTPVVVGEFRGYDYEQRPWRPTCCRTSRCPRSAARRSTSRPWRRCSRT